MTLLWHVAVAAAVIIMVGVATARADVMPPEMRASVILYQNELHAEWLEWFTELNGPWVEPVTPHSHPPRSYGEGVEQWRDLVAQWFLPQHVDEALLVMWCESRGDPSAKNRVSTASGLFQMLRGWWGGTWSTAVPAFDPFDPELNVRYAAVIFYAHSPEWRDWRASRGCHGL